MHFKAISYIVLATILCQNSLKINYGKTASRGVSAYQMGRSGAVYTASTLRREHMQARLVHIFSAFRFLTHSLVV
jgi:hypothetical protein